MWDLEVLVYIFPFYYNLIFKKSKQKKKKKKPVCCIASRKGKLLDLCILKLKPSVLAVKVS